MQLSQIKNLYAFDDGDTLTPGMGIIIDAGYGLQQYWNPTKEEVIATDFTKHPATLYPQPYSTKLGSIVVGQTEGQQWYYNNISSEAGILQDGAVKAKFASLFQKTTVTMNGKTFPALKIIGNLATKDDHTDKYIYYQSTYEGQQFTCQQLIPIQASVGDTYDILLSTEGPDGTGDNVLSNDVDYVKYTANLQLAGQSVASGVTYAWQHMEGNAWKDITASVEGMIEVSGNTLKVFNTYVNGVDVFRSVATYNGKTYYKGFEVSDIHDPFYIDPGCNIAGDAVRKGETVTFSPAVYDRSSGEDVTSDGWTFSYTLMKRSDKTVITDLTVKDLTRDNIKKYGGISVRIVASKE
jgi:hypothetical protein